MIIVNGTSTQNALPEVSPVATKINRHSDAVDDLPHVGGWFFRSHLDSCYGSLKNFPCSQGTSTAPGPFVSPVNRRVG